MVNESTSGSETRRSYLRKATVVGTTLGFAGCTRSTNSGGSDGSTNSAGPTETTSTSTTSETSSSSKTVRIGIPTALSGPYASLGELQVQGFEMRAEEINANGGLQGKEIELFTRDNEGSNDKAVQNVRGLVENQRVDLITGVISSSLALAIAPTCRDLGIPFLSSSNGTAKLTGEQCNEYTFRTNVHAAPEASAGIRYLLEEKGFEKVFYLGADYSWGQSVLKYTKVQLEQMGYNPDDVLMETEFAPLDTQDYSTYITKMKNSGAAAGYCALSGTPAIRFLTQANNLGLIQQMHLSGVTFAQVDHIRNLGADMEGISSVARWVFTSPKEESKQFVRKWLDEYGQYPHVFAGMGYQGLDAYKHVVDEAGSTNPEDVISTWPGFTWDGVRGEMEMRACDHQTMADVPIVEVVSESEYEGPFKGEGEITSYPQIVKTVAPEDAYRDCGNTGCNL